MMNQQEVMAKLRGNSKSLNSFKAGGPSALKPKKSLDSGFTPKAGGPTALRPSKSLSNAKMAMPKGRMRSF